jgi:hypothetical protein
MHSKIPSFGQRTTLRQPTIVRRPTGTPEDAPPVSHSAAPLHAQTSIQTTAPPTDAVVGQTAAMDEAPPPAGTSAQHPPTPEPVPVTVPSDTAVDSDARWARRTTSRLGAQIMHQSLPTPITCTIRDTSSTGARLEMVIQRGGSMTRDRVPDQFMLFMPADRLEIDCQVMWRQGPQVGVRYASPARRTARQQPAKKPEAPKKPHTSLIKMLIDPL